MSEALLKPLARFAVSTAYSGIPEKELAWAQAALCDFVTVALPGALMPVAQNVLAYLKKTSPSPEGRCTLLGANEKMGASAACLFNGTASHALDFDDVSWATIGHPTVSVAPAALAAAQEMGLGGKDVLRAYVVGVEVMHQIARWTMPVLSENGWHTTPAYGAFGAAAAAAALYGMTEEETACALGIAASRSGGVRANFGTHTKALHAGLSAAAGIEAAKLAQCGVTANPAAIEAADGYAQCFAKPLGDARVDIGSFWDLAQNGLVFKQYPCCSGSHPTNDVWGGYVAKSGVSADDIEKIEAGVSLLGPRELNCHYPQNAVQAKFSLEFAIASRLIQGPIEITSFTDEKVLDPRVQAFMKKIDMKIDPELAKLGFIGTAPIRMTVHLKNGEKVFLQSDLAEGNPEKPLSKEKHKEKFASCMRACGRRDGAAALWEKLSDFSALSAKDIAALGN